MKAFTISEIRNFMSQLLLKDTFDHLNLLELTLTTNITYTIDGALHPDFYDAGEAELLKAGRNPTCAGAKSVLFAFL